MRRWSRYLAGVVAVTGLLALVNGASAETCKLEIRRFSATDGISADRPYEQWFRAARSQSFFMQIGGPEGMRSGSQQPGTPEFSKVITKEPSEYAAKHPFRGVASLGSQHFGFVLDAAPEPKAEEGQEAKKQPGSSSGFGAAIGALLGRADSGGGSELQAYRRLYFDLNRNGDLTDDGVIEAQTSQAMSSNYVFCNFPATTVKIAVGETQFDYAFAMNVYSHTSSNYSYANASLTAAAYREGELSIDGKTCRVVLVDFNSNGRYDDQSKIDDSIQLADGTVYPSVGDMLYLIDDATEFNIQGNPYDPSTNSSLHYVSKLVNYQGSYYDAKISPSGDELSLARSATPVGYVSNANQGYRAVVYGDQGFLAIAGDDAGKAVLPVGPWKLASYTLERSEVIEAKKPEAEQEQSGGTSWLEGLRQAIVGTPGTPATARSRRSIVSARAKRDCAAVEVQENATVELPFGGPYRPEVTVGYRQGDGMVSLSLALVGQAGEVCTNLVVNDQRPGKPTFTISTEAGEVVQQGSFEYG